MKKDLLLAYLALGAICIIWGTTYLALRLAVADFPPFLFVAIRQVIAGSLLFIILWIAGKVNFPSLTYIWHQAVAGFFMISLGNGLVAWAEVYIPSGVAAVICSLMPVAVIVINMSISKGEKPSIPIVLGTLVGLLGIMLIFSEHLADFGNSAYITGIVLTFVAVLSWAGASIWLKKQGESTNPFLNAALQMFFGGIWLIPCTFLFDDHTNVHVTMDTFYVMLYLVLIGSVVAYACYSYALKKLPMSLVSLYAYVNPIVAVLLGWLVLNEKLNLRIGIAIALTVAGIYIVNRGYQISKAWKARLKGAN